jgi:hypothetical protein
MMGLWLLAGVKNARSNVKAAKTKHKELPPAHDYLLNSRLGLPSELNKHIPEQNFL